MKEFIEYDGMALAELIRKKEVKPTELLEVTVQRIEKVNPKLNAVIHKMYQGRDAAKSWESMIMQGKGIEARFCGVPFLLKDLLAEYQGALFMRGPARSRGMFQKLTVNW